MFDSSLAEWLNELAGRTPTPGGGAAAGVSAAMSAALLGMVSVYTTGPKWQDREKRMQAINADVTGLRAEALQLAAQDEVAFGAVGAAYALPKETESEKTQRSSAIQSALLEACQPPKQTIILATQLITLAIELAAAGNPSVISDVAVAAAHAKTAIESAIVNVEINARLLKDDAAKQVLDELVAGTKEPLQAANQVIQTVRTRIAG